jgi:MFS family permease
VKAGRTAVAPLGSPPFRRYLLGQFPSLTGSWAQVVALSWLVASLSPRALGWVVALQFLPSLVLGPWFGVVADRHDRRRLLMLAECGLGLVAAAYALASLTGVLTLPVICVLATAWGVINALDTPARRALVPALVPRDQAASASALTGTVLLIGMTAGSALGGALVAAAGVTAAFAVNAASFAIDVVVLSTIQAGPSPKVKRAPRQVREGISYVAHRPELGAPLLALAMISTLAFTVQVSVPTLVRQSFAGGPAQLGAALTALAAGSLTGMLIRAARGMPGRRALPLATAIMACGLAATAVAPALPAALAGLATVGIGWSCFLGAAIAILQSADPRMLGRVMSLFALVLLGGTAAGAPAASALATALGPRAPFFAGTVAAIAALAVTMGITTTGPQPTGEERMAAAVADEDSGPQGMAQRIDTRERQPPVQNLRRRLASASPCRMPASTAAGMADRSMRLMPIACVPASSALITSTIDPLSVRAAISLSSCPAGVKRVFWPLVAAMDPSKEMISTRSCPRARSALVPDRIPPSM